MPKLGDNCPHCGGSGNGYEVGDAHRSPGIVPCRWYGDGLQCVKGKLIKDNFTRPATKAKEKIKTRLGASRKIPAAKEETFETPMLSRHKLMRLHHALHQITGEMAKSFASDVHPAKVNKWLTDLEAVAKEMRS